MTGISMSVCLPVHSTQKLSRTTLPLSMPTSARAPGDEGMVTLALSPGTYLALSRVRASRVAASVTEVTSPRQSDEDTHTIRVAECARFGLVTRIM